MQQQEWPIARTTLLEYTHYYLVGIKGVAMTSLAQCLLDAGKIVGGSDVAEDFVTQPILDVHAIAIDTTFSAPLPEKTQCVIYTSAHHAKDNPQVIDAVAKGLPVWTQAEAIASIANTKNVIAVCGVGGKSTISAMISWVLEQAWQDKKIATPPSYSVGVGSISGMEKTGSWHQESDFFVVEADEYVTEPELARTGELHIPRFAYLQPSIIICPNIRYDHPDVYENLDHTITTFRRFFTLLSSKSKQNTTTFIPTLILHSDDDILMTLAREFKDTFEIKTYGIKNNPDFVLGSLRVEPGKTLGSVHTSSDNITKNTYPISLPIPGEYNLLNATATVVAASVIGLDPNLTTKYLADFRSTKRRVEFIGEKNGIRYYDDYAHHPMELSAVIRAFQDWYPNKRVVFAFQPHTFSRTKELFSDFVTSLSQAQELILLDIFASARESLDATTSSQLLSDEINSHNRKNNASAKEVICVHTTLELHDLLVHQLKSGDVCVTLGAGDIYLVHDQIVE